MLKCEPLLFAFTCLAIVWLACSGLFYTIRKFFFRHPGSPPLHSYDLDGNNKAYSGPSIIECFPPANICWLLQPLNHVGGCLKMELAVESRQTASRKSVVLCMSTSYLLLLNSCKHSSIHLSDSNLITANPDKV